MLKLSLYISTTLNELAVAKSYGLRVKLGSDRENFKVTLLERPPEKSYSTSKIDSEIDKIKKVSILFIHVYL